MNDFLFVIGSVLKWVVQKPKDSILLVVYLFTIHGSAAILNYDSSSGKGLLYTLLYLAPTLFYIMKGLPLDCLNFQGIRDRETA